MSEEIREEIGIKLERIKNLTVTETDFPKKLLGKNWEWSEMIDWKDQTRKGTKQNKTKLCFRREIETSEDGGMDHQDKIKEKAGRDQNQ